MNLELTLQPLQLYASDQTTLKKLLEDAQSQPPFYGLVVGRFGKLDGFFSSFELLQYCLKVGLEHVEDIDHLRTFTKHLNKHYMTLTTIPATALPIEDDVELILIRKADKYIGCIDRANYFAAVAKMQQHSLRHYETIFQAMPNGVIAVDIEGRIIMMNQAGEKISGVPYEKAIGRFITDVVPPKGLLQVLQTGQGQIEKYKVRKRWYISYREPIYDGKQLVGAVGVFDDISRMEALTSDLDTYRQLLRENELLLNSSSLGIAVMAANGDILRQNEDFQQLYFSIMYEDYERNQFRKAFEEVIHKQQETIIHIQNKQRRKLKCRFSAIQHAQGASTERIIVQIEDITADYEQQQQTMLLKQHIRQFFALRHIETIPISPEFEERLTHVAKVNAPILLIGDKGTGRTVTAKQIIKYSERHLMPFIEVDCANASKKQLEQVLFSMYDPPPLFTLAAGGTLYMKNIDHLPIHLQKKFIPILQVLNELNIRLITSIGDDSIQHLDEQLYYSINAISLSHPPLKERPEQAKQVIIFLFAQLCEKHDRQVTLPEESLTFLLNNDWLCNFYSIAVLLEHLCLNLAADVWHPTHFLNEKINVANKPIIVNTIFPLKDAINEVEKEMLLLLIEKNISYRQMAKILEVNPSTIVRKIKKIEEGSYD